MALGAWSVGLFVAAALSLPLPPVPLPTPSLPPVSTPVLASPALPVATPALPLATPHPGASAAGANNGRSSTSGSQPASVTTAGGSAGGHTGVPIPFTAIYISSTLDAALLVAVAVLPLLVGIWLMVFGRTFAEARRRRDAEVRLMLAADLGLRPRDVATMNTKALFDLREKSAFDELTGVLRRAAGVAMAEREIARAQRHSTPLTVAFVDVDGLKETNENEGQTGGDALLVGLVALLKDGLRAEDAIVRYGGDEFVCVLPDTTARDARSKLSAIQDAAAARGIRFCAGLAQLLRSDDVVSLFARADGDLYEFKANRGEIVPLPARPRDPSGEKTVTA